MKIKPHLEVIKQAADLLGADTTEGADFLKKVVGGYWDKFAEKPRQAVFSALTDKAKAVNIEEWMNRNLRKGGLETYKSTGKVPYEEVPKYDVIKGDYLHRQPKKSEIRTGPPRRENTPNPTGFQEFAGEHMVGVAKEPGTYPQWMEPAVRNPELASKLAGTAVASGIPLTAGAFLTAYADSSKPRSDYAYPVEPTRGSYDETGGVAASSNTYNPSVESARVSAQLKHDLEEQKFRHKVALQEMRDESRTPGVQGSPSPMSGGSFDIGSALGNIYGNRNTNYL